MSWRERIALRIAPSLYVPYREEREQAFRDLAEVAYGSRDAVWTSPRVLVGSALRNAEGDCVEALAKVEIVLRRDLHDRIGSYVEDYVEGRLDASLALPAIARELGMDGRAC